MARLDDDRDAAASDGCLEPAAPAPPGSSQAEHGAGEVLERGKQVMQVSAQSGKGKGDSAGEAVCELP